MAKLSSDNELIEIVDRTPEQIESDWQHDQELKALIEWQKKNYIGVLAEDMLRDAELIKSPGAVVAQVRAMVDEWDKAAKS